jgi:hypothetical protein
VINLLHVVVDGVNTTARASVTASGASRGRGGLGRGVRDGVAGAGASTLEGVVETEPVTSLVGERAAEVVVGSRATGDRGEEHDNTVILGGT